MNIFKFFSIFLKSITHKKFYYSYGCIDAIIQNIFKNKQKGFYVDVGCGHPIKNNNTYLLNKKGWGGVNIDLDQDNIDLFNIYRKNDYNFVSAVSDKVKDVDLYFYHSKSAINTINKNVADHQKAIVTNIKKIQSNTLNNILDKSPFNNKKIDFLTIDVEGSELSVLKSFDFIKYSPKVIVVEFLDLSLSKLEIKNLNISNAMNSEIHKLVISKGYTLSNMIHSDLVYINNDFRD